MRRETVSYLTLVVPVLRSFSFPYIICIYTINSTIIISIIIIIMGKRPACQRQTPETGA